MSDYRYGKHETTLHIERMDGDAYVRVVNEEDGSFYAAILPAAERQAAAQALAGDGWRVVAAEHIYPYRYGDYIVLGPETFSDADKTVISHKGENYYARQEKVALETDPADVRVGDVVEVEADDGSWLVRGEVIATDHGAAYPIRVGAPTLGGLGEWPRLKDATVRVLRRAAPEPDPAEVEALELVLADWRLWHKANPVTVTDREWAEQLWHRSVRVVKEEQ